MVAYINPWVTLAIFAALALYWLIPGTGPTVEMLRESGPDAEPSGERPPD